MAAIDKKVLIIGCNWPEPGTTAAGGRMLQLIRFFLKQDYELTFASTAAESEYSYDLESIGVRTQSILLNHYSFDEFIGQLNPTVVLFDRFLTEEQFGWRVAEHCPQAMRILDTEDLHSLRTARQLSHKKKQPFSIKSWLDQDLTKREIASIYRSDISLIISLYEMELLTEELKLDPDLLLHLPMMYNEIDVEQRKDWLDFDQKKNFICIGNGKHAPNVDAIKTLKLTIWPLIRKRLPKANLYVYGAYLPQEIQQMHKPKEGFYVMGHAANAQEVITRARLSLAPLNFGAGIKGKLLDSMLFGTPSITTHIGAEGICLDMPWNGCIANAPKDFAHAAVELYLDREKWLISQKNGMDIINSCYDKAVLQQRLSQKIEQVGTTLNQHRSGNFIGAMLLHHSMASTKYMSKWITAKNKKT
ncbi:glycosyltransferase [Arenibacter aquaticus]|uniref:Glycosyltransferase n=1 Tax=Arenibacter aquaticus TaxID=2489054 RepID=A0A3S0BUN4_9FLAO|nr:glycosyltransferase [Arenibacter aquaticus]RTE51971.1 glycosyltransferase [Arenibacter aquaticus]